MPAMPVMMEQMHQGAGQDEQEGQHAEEMRRMLRDQVEARDHEKAAEDETAPGLPPGRLGKTCTISLWS
jgi:hypothetical protein